MKGLVLRLKALSAELSGFWVWGPGSASGSAEAGELQVKVLHKVKGDPNAS